MSSKKFKTLDGLTSTGNVAFGDDTFIVDVTTDRVGINKSDPQTALDIDGTVAATLFSGDGSELISVDASTLGSLANTDFLRSNADTSFSTGNFNFSSSGTLTFTNGTLRLNNNRTLRLGTVNTPGFSMSFDGTSKMIVQGFGTNAETEIISAAGTSIRRATNTQPIKIQGNNTTNNNTATITSENLTDNRTFTLPNVANSSFIMSEGTQVINGNKTFTNALTLSTAGTATNHAVRADRNLTGGDGINTIGNLTANRTISVNAGTGLIANSTGVHVGAGDGIIANTTSISTAGMVTALLNSTGSVNTPHRLAVITSTSSTASANKSTVIASGTSTASGIESAVMASFISIANGTSSAVMASQSSTASTARSTVIASRDSTASGIESAVIASFNSLANSTNCAVVASRNSTASSAAGRSAVVAGDGSTASGVLSAVVAAQEGGAVGTRSAVIASKDSLANGTDCAVVAGDDSTTSGVLCAVMAAQSSGVTGTRSAVIASNKVINTMRNSLAMGFANTVSASIANRKIHFFGENGNIYNDGELRLGNLNWSSSIPAGGWALSVTGGVSANNTNNGDLRFLDGTSERVRFTNNGDIQATGNITAFFSDERLKTFKGKIESPLKKINSLNGYHYELNELAESFGYSTDKQYIGVSAQEVEAVLPEVVSLAPFDIEFDENGKEYSKSGENYKTVDYNKLTVLLIEGMKEQQNEIQQLKETVNQLKSILNK